MKKKYWVIIAFAILIVLYFTGPHPSTPVFTKDLPVVPSTSWELERYVSIIESKHHVRPGNQAQIVWADSTMKKTEYAIVYLHGFFASQMEGDPVHRDFAKEFGCNLYLARLADHGIDTVD